MLSVSDRLPRAVCILFFFSHDNNIKNQSIQLFFPPEIFKKLKRIRISKNLQKYVVKKRFRIRQLSFQKFQICPSHKYCVMNQNYARWHVKQSIQ